MPVPAELGDIRTPERWLELPLDDVLLDDRLLKIPVPAPMTVEDDIPVPGGTLRLELDDLREL